MSEFSSALITCASVLTIKSAVVSLLTVRARMMSRTFNFKVESENLLARLVAPLFLTFIPLGGSKNVVDMGERIALNNATNEPLFVALALASGLAASSPPAVLVNVFTYARVAHNIAFLAMPYITTAPRTAFYVTGMGASLAMAGLLLMK